MKRILCVLFSILLSLFFVGCNGLIPPSSNDSGSDNSSVQNDENKVNGIIETWEVPQTYGRNDNYIVEVSENGKTWTKLAVYNVYTGHQKGDRLIAQQGSPYNTDDPFVASLVTFDFSGVIAVKVTYQGGNLKEGGYVISPASYNIQGEQQGNTVTFQVEQDEESPRKIVFRPEGEWETETLHIMTNVLEEEYKVEKTSPNVYVVEEGEEIPMQLPKGKDTYYFEKGIHTLPGGYWVDIDLGSVQAIKSFDLSTPHRSNGVLPSGLCFEIQAKQSLNDAYKTVYKSVGKAAENNFNLKGVALNANARYFRLILHGNYASKIDANTRYVHIANVQELKLYNSAGQNLALGKAVAGAGQNYKVVTDGLNAENYGHMHAGETFSAQSNYTYYLEKGSVVKGSIISENTENITISGRGILDSSALLSTHDLAEGRNGSILMEHCTNVVVEGITLLHAPMWMMVINYSQNVLVSGVNLFGCRTNADGIHFSATKHAVATGCFIRTTDDLFVMYHYGTADDVTFQNSVLWSDGGRVLLLGLSNLGDINNVTMKNCDVITFQNVWDLFEAGGFAQIIATGGCTIYNTVIEDIRIDAVRFPAIAQFLQIRGGNDGSGAGHVKKVVVKNVTWSGKYKPKSLISEVVEGGTVQDVQMKNVVIDGKVVDATNISSYFNVDENISVKFS